MRGSNESPNRLTSTVPAGDYLTQRIRGFKLRRDYHLKTSSVLLGVFGLTILFECKDATAQETCVGSHTLQTQSDVDTFPSCSRVSGNLTISSSVDITHLTALSSITSITGALVISDNSALTNVDGLRNLTDVGRSITITRNAVLRHVDGLAGLQSYGTGEPAFLRIVDNPSLAQCSCGLYGIYAWTHGFLAFDLDGNAPRSDCNRGGVDLRANACAAVGREYESAPGASHILGGNYPNPFDRTTTISYSLPEPAEVTLTITDLLGRQLRRMAMGQRPSGSYEVSVDATGLPSGAYFYRLQAGNRVETKRMMVVK